MPRDVLVLLVVLLSSTASFGLGMLSGRQSAPQSASDGFWIEDRATSTPAVLGASITAPITANAQKQITSPTEAPVGQGSTDNPGIFVGSKNGTKYYLPRCSGAKRIKPENKIWFVTVQDASAGGRTPASNCPGL